MVDNADLEVADVVGYVSEELCKILPEDGDAHDEQAELDLLDLVV